jgi:hypothetical protein
VEWGLFEIDFVDVVQLGDEHDSSYIEHALSLGLERLQQVIHGESHATRQKLLGGSHPESHHFFLEQGLNDSNYRYDSDGRLLYRSELRPGDMLARSNHPFVKEADTGPADAFQWGHNDDSQDIYVNSREQKALRARGYCMWDRARLVDWPTFHKYWRAPHHPISDHEIALNRAEMIQMHMSWRRKTIYELGGRGWWDAADESKIVWPARKNRSDQAQRNNRLWSSR